MPFSGYEFTYDNGREAEENVYVGLIEQYMASNEWSFCFPSIHLLHLDREWSDHAPLKLILCRDSNRVELGDRPFRFEQL